MPTFSERTQALPDSLFGWIPQYIRTPSIEIMHKNGLDAYQFVAFLEMMVSFAEQVCVRAFAY